MELSWLISDEGFMNYIARVLCLIEVMENGLPDSIGIICTMLYFYFDFDWSLKGMSDGLDWIGVWGVGW